MDETALMFESRISGGERGPTTWKDMLENAWNGIANWQTKRRSNNTKFLIPVWDDHQIRKEELEMLELGHEMVDLTFCGQSINWQDLSQNGLKHATDDWHD